MLSQTACPGRSSPNESGSAPQRLRGRARATVTRRLCTIAGFYRYAVEEESAGASLDRHATYIVAAYIAGGAR